LSDIITSPFDFKSEKYIISKIINSSLPQETKTSIVKSLNNASSWLKEHISNIEEYEKANSSGNLAETVTKGIVSFAPDIVAAEAVGPASIEMKLEKLGENISSKAAPLVKKLAPKALALVERGAKSGLTKVMAAKGAIEGVANTEDDENIYLNGLKGAVKGELEGIYMHGLGEAAGKVMPAIAKGISKTGVNSAVATSIATPLANAGVLQPQERLELLLLNKD